jgi:hypothetical protein
MLRVRRLPRPVGGWMDRMRTLSRRWFRRQPLPRWPKVLRLRSCGRHTRTPRRWLLVRKWVHTRTYTDRGAGCSGTAPKLTCDVAWINSTASTNVTIWGTVGQAGELDASATVTSLVETEPAATLPDNTVALEILPQAPTRTRPPVLKRSDSGFAPPRAAHVGTTAVVKTSFSSDEAVVLKVTAISDTGKPLTLLNRSRIGSVATGKPRTLIVYPLASAGNVALSLRIAYSSLKHGHTYKVVVSATAADGQRSQLVIPFRL